MTQDNHPNMTLEEEDVHMGEEARKAEEAQKAEEARKAEAARKAAKAEAEKRSIIVAILTLDKAGLDIKTVMSKQLCF